MAGHGADRHWQLWIDTGGTFTDAVARTPDGRIRRAKVLSTGALRGRIARGAARSVFTETGWEFEPSVLRGLRFRLLDSDLERTVVDHDPSTGEIRLDAPLGVAAPRNGSFELSSGEPAPLLAARLLTGTPHDAPLPPCSLRLATTLGTNALLQRAGVTTALFVTRGFADVPRIGTQQRPDLFALDVRLPEPLHEVTVEVCERIAADGAVVTPLDEEALRAEAERLVGDGVTTAAVALVHAWHRPDHERRAAEILREAGFRHVSCSAELAHRIKFLPRLQTAVTDAYLTPVVQRYLDEVERPLSSDDSRLLVMTSAGGLLPPTTYRPKDSLLSGPAGGVVGAASAGRASGFDRVIGFDMGGTSTDVTRIDGDYDYVFEHGVGDVRLAAPALAIESVAAGGGSVCRLDGPRLRVGPQSAGARPGPACYLDGGPLTVTDVNLLAGIVVPDRFEIPVSEEASRQRLDELLGRLRETTGETPAVEATIEGLQRIANEAMADAIRRVSVRRGYDPADYALVAFGGAGGQHACRVAESLGMTTVVVPVDASLLSAIGLGEAVLERFHERQVLRPLDAVEAELETGFDELGRLALDDVRDAGGDDPEVRRRLVHLRFAGQDATIEIEWRPGLDLGRAFEARYRALYGHWSERRAIEVESIRAVASTPAAEPPEPERPVEGRAGETARRRVLLGGRWSEVPLLERERLPGGFTHPGPALIVEAHCTTLVPQGWTAHVDSRRAIVIRRDEAPPAAGAVDRDAPEAIRLELFTRRFEALVGEMGDRLEHTAVSTNVKERLDFSCALLDGGGRLVANAPHVPVHLGALGVCVRRVTESMELRPGDVVVTNHPAFGGSHLPDVTVITPVFLRDRPDRPFAFVANRAHHAEIGGSRPGSMPPDARTLAEEGVPIAPTRLFEAGEPRWNEIEAMLRGGRWPSRAVEDNLADLRAAVAANHAGAEALLAMVDAHGADVVERYMESLQSLAEQSVRDALRDLGDGRYAATQRLDDGSPIAVAVTVEGDTATVDFTGSAGVHPGNLNAGDAVIRSAVIYVMRLMIRKPLPLNEGIMRAVRIVSPRGMLNPGFSLDPAEAPAVVGGNVETSQRVVDTLLEALGLVAGSQGTMNNVIFGDDRYGYYETVGGGCGAGPDFDGASGVHSHMTNTRITDVEILEHRYPVRLERFELRRGSGGAGRHRGGDGLVREIRFLAPASLSLLTQHRRERPYALAGGEPGANGAQRVERADGTTRRLDSIDGCEVDAGDRLILETPGGGGYGRV